MTNTYYSIADPVVLYARPYIAFLIELILEICRDPVADY